MTVSVFGNPDLPEDAMPVALIPELRKRFPNITFVHQDPNEECTPPETVVPRLRSRSILSGEAARPQSRMAGHSTAASKGSESRDATRDGDHERRPDGNRAAVEWWIIDAVKGISDVRLITEKDIIEVKRRLTMHDYDLGMHLTLLKKIYPKLQLRIIGIPFGAPPATVLPDVTNFLSTALQESAMHSSYTDHTHE
ncbi:MAG: hypothetical protein A3B30_01755 [Candidatus Komeilibacteria bacterium RIFCSPLOWO2_01_FULL_52_15]|uniref:Uncharacterized protein n=1 Tax=Candidatus Komeilibacteria bacterium RIFCSPLOWO2_01_FULL_52_15 TaxID=1798551 RepID=A0A1G2BSF9_9BACT|nr:MAG: hypothetical protein A3B30_01755 [Candidatus Komeilibacteria bacterium RIFCSPLOWO2_01_FULL_52_15]